MAFLSLIPLLFLVAIVRSQQPNPLVRVNNGILQGTWKVSTNGRNYASFMGVPYARPPVGKYRFRLMDTGVDIAGRVLVLDSTFIKLLTTPLAQQGALRFKVGGPEFGRVNFGISISAFSDLVGGHE
ncbi:jg22075 [Pararge aegeria aegeria]|uniref:Jg22075 protein n=1 Tax=Pararge aegeria aegeria TaxID=348720 RepID=A0A8S4RPV0_9NEOP|nr:jg22075 [Pararge aegeria aegeria]